MNKLPKFLQKSDSGLPTRRGRTGKLGFTMTRLMVAAAIFSLVSAGVISLYLACQRVWYATTLNIHAAREVSMALNKIVYGMGTNLGMRSAIRVTLRTNCSSWRTDMEYPLAATSLSHGIITPSTPDGSWRMIALNTNGTQWIDYNVKASNLVFWSAPNTPNSRLKIANYIAGAQVTTNSDGINITLTAMRQHGEMRGAYEASTFIKLRNIK